MRPFVAVLLACLALTACDGAPKSKLPDIRLPTVSARQGESLASCPTPRCLTVYLAPWCGYCRQATPMLVEMKKLLAGNTARRIIVGMDDPSPVGEYAQIFGGDTLMDPAGGLRTSGVPHFWITNGEGGVLREVSGLPQVENAEQLADYFGLN